MAIRQVQDVPGCLLERLQFVSLDIVPAVLGETIGEERPIGPAIEDYGPVASGFARTGAGNALLDHAAAEIGVDLSSLGPLDRVLEDAVVDTVLVREADEPGVLEYPHMNAAIGLEYITLSVM